MKYAIVESGGKQYKAVEGETIDVDRLPAKVGDKVELRQVLLTVDEEAVQIGSPTVAGIQVSTTIVDHFKGPKIVIFKYSPKKRIRVKSGHRQQYTRLSVDVIGKPGEARKVTKVEKAEPSVKGTAEKQEKKTAPAKAAKTTKTTAKPSASKAGSSATKKRSSTKSPAKPPAKKPSKAKPTGKTQSKKPTASKAPAKAPAKKSSTTKTTKTTKTDKK